MIISFDIDNTLIPYSNEFEVYELSFCMKLFKAEALRKGTVELFQILERQGHELWVYTTSYRSITYMKKTFYLHGLKPKRFINEKINQEYLKRAGNKSSKNPKLFGIDIHIDDSEGVAMEGDRLGFKTIIVKPYDSDWNKRIVDEVSKLNDKTARNS